MPKLTKVQKLAEAQLDNFITVGCAFLPLIGGQKPTLYTFKFPKKDAQYICEGDQALVIANNRYSVVQIQRIDQRPQNPMQIKLSWIVQIVNRTRYDNLVQLDKSTEQEFK